MGKRARHAGEQATTRSGHISLSMRFVLLIVAVVMLTGTTLGIAVTLLSMRHSAEERLRSLDYSAKVIAAAAIPLVADEESEAIGRRIDDIIEAAQIHDIECVCLFDAAGNAIGQTEGTDACMERRQVNGLVQVFTEPQVVSVPVEVDGLQVASVVVQFRPVGLADAVYEPARVTLLVLAATMVVSVLWGAWLVLRTVVEPVGSLRDVAKRISSGERVYRMQSQRGDEIGELANALDEMTAQLLRQEEELLDSYRSLEMALKEKTDLALRLERAMNLKSDFVAVASHELRSPLAILRLYSEMLESGEFGELDPELAESIESIVQAVSRLSSIVQSLMDVALLERGLMSLERSAVSLDEIVRQAVHDSDALARLVDVRVVAEDSLPAVNLEADAVRLRQALDNIISNAVKHSGHGDVVRVRMRADEDDVYVSVADSGPGIPPERADVLFELFGRVNAQDNAGKPGLGLGLPISDRVVRAHGGTITFEPNQNGRGTVFTMRLPRSDAGAQTAERTVRVV